jgi:hypothetical protein
MFVYKFKVIIKANNETIDDKIANLLILHWKIMHQIGAITICEIIQTIYLQI